MILLKQMIEKKLELHQEFMLKKQYLRGIWQFYSCINLSTALFRLYGIEYDEKRFVKRNILWKRLFSQEGKFSRNNFVNAQKYMNEDRGIIIKALELITKVNNDMQFEMSQFDPTGSSYVGCIAYEFPE